MSESLRDSSAVQMQLFDKHSLSKSLPFFSSTNPLLLEGQSETELTASVLQKRSKTHKRLKERFLIRRNRTKRANFPGNPLFQATYNNTTENSQTNLSFVH